MRALLLILIALAGLPAHQAFAASSQAGSAPFKAPASGAGNSYAPTFSADGRFAAFLSHANNLATNDDRQPHLDLFLRDLITSNTVLVSVGGNGLGGADNNVITFALSSNAGVIAFESAAGNLAGNDTNRAADIFARDLAAGTTTLVSRNVDGTASGNAPSTGPLISVDGRYVIFESAASNLVTNDFNNTNDIFIHDLATHTTSLVSVNADGTASPNGPSFSPSISEDGLTVAFVSRATNLVNGVTNRAGEIYLRFVAAGTNLWGTGSYEGLGTASSALSASSPVLSSDGRFVAFKTSRGRIVRYDTQQPTNAVLEWYPPLVSPPPPTGTWFSNAFIFYDNPRLGPISDALADSTLAISRDGRWLSCLSSNVGGAVTLLRQIDFETLLDTATLIPPPGGSQASYYYLTNRSTVAQAVSTNLTFPGNTNLYSAPAASHAMSADGQRYAFITPTALPGSGSNVLRGPAGLWFRDMATNACVLISTNRAGQPGPDLSGIMPALSPNGALVAWDSPDANLVEDDLNQAWDVFAREVTTGETRLISARHPNLPEKTGRALSWLTPGSVSGDGRRVTVATYDSSLFLNDTNRWFDVVLRDLEGGTNVDLNAPFVVTSSTNFVAFPSNGVVAAKLSANGLYAIEATRNAQGTNLYWRDFTTGANLLVATDQVQGISISPNGRYVAYEYGSPSQILLMVAKRSTNFWMRGGGDYYYFSTGSGSSINPLLSSDGISSTNFNFWLAFLSRSQNLTADLVTGNPTYQLFVYGYNPTNYSVRMRLASYNTSASQLPNGISTNVGLAGGATNAVFSADARFLFFEQTGSNVIYRFRPLDLDIVTTTTNTQGIFYNRARPTNDLVCAGCGNPSVSADGRFVAYESRGATTNVFLRDLVTGTTEFISRNGSGQGGNGPSFSPQISWDARYVVFGSRASDLVSEDTNRSMDVFVRDRLTGITHCLSRNPVTGRSGNRASSNPVLSADGRTVAFQSFASDLFPGDYNETRDVFVVRLGGGDSDADGMDDDWEIAYFSTLARDGSGDFDVDHATDLSEFKAGTNPADGTNVFAVLKVSAFGFSPHPYSFNGFPYVELLWNATPTRRYRVQVMNRIGETWTDVGEEIMAAGLTSFSAFSVSAASAGAFYRVRLAD